MEAILMKAASFIAVIILGYGLRKAGFFKEEDFYVLSKYSLQGTTQGRYLTGGVPPVRFSM